ncbi:MAG: site-specific DNA-methyltransferase [Patescibacteria group bacterium]
MPKKLQLHSVEITADTKLTQNILKENKTLKQEIKQLKSRKRYGLVWESKPEEVVELCKEKLPVLVEDTKREIKTDDKKPVNILIEGDNYHALSVLNYTHEGKVDFIYIDPPYNTGNKDFIFNDRYVDKEDTYRHSKWLSFMHRRLILAKNLLKNTGLILVSISDIEMPQLRMLMNEIFGEDNIEIMVWHKVGDDSGRLKITRRFRLEHEYIIVGYKKKEKIFFRKYKEDRNYKNVYTNPDNDPRGAYKQGIISNTEESSNPKSEKYFIVVTPSGKKYTRQWRCTKEEFDELVKDNRIYYGKKGDSVPSLKVFISEPKDATPISILQNFGTAKTAGLSLLELFNGKRVFDYPKPVELIRHLIQIATSPEAIILDFMAGTGTTGQAVLELNKDGGQRRFILCTNNENNICSEVCYPRVRKVIKGYTNLKGKKVGGLKENLKYFKTDFVDNATTDKNKKKLVDKSTEMLCLKEDCFERVKTGKSFNIFKNPNEKYLGIIYDDDGIESFKKEAKKINKNFVVYVFSLDDSAREEEFEDMEDLVELKPIPAVILNVYKRIFK